MFRHQRHLDNVVLEQATIGRPGSGVSKRIHMVVGDDVPAPVEDHALSA
jgi:hypothetical protein